MTFVPIPSSQIFVNGYCGGNDGSRELQIADDLGNEIDAKTFQFRSFKGGFVGAPSARYMSMLLAGARYWDLPRSYQDSLRATRPSSFFTKPLFDVSNAGLGRSHGKRRDERNIYGGEKSRGLSTV